MIYNTKLESGLTVAFDKITSVESVAVTVAINFGGRFESHDNLGIAHFLEHMAFKGTTTRSKRDIAEEFDSMGACFNACTGEECTKFYAMGLREDFEQIVDLLSDIIINSTFPENEVEKERGVILQEIAMYNDSPDDVVFDNYNLVCYPDQPLGRPILGTEKSVSSLTRDDIASCAKKNYVAKRMIVSVAGNLESDKVISVINNKFSKLRSGEKDTPLESAYNSGSSIVEKDLEQLQIVFGFKGISYENLNAMHISMITSVIFGSSMSSRLFQKIRDEMGLVYSIYSFNFFYKETGVFGVYAGADPKNSKLLIKTSLEELALLKENLKQEEVDRAIKQLVAKNILSEESTMSRSGYAANCFIKYGKFIERKDIIESIKSVSSQQIKDFIKKTLDPSTLTVSILGKTEKSPSYSEIVNFI